MLLLPRIACLAAFPLIPLLPLAGLSAGGDGDPVDYLRDVRPILAENCYTCHGPDERMREARLRLDREESTLRKRRGRHFILPGQPKESLVVQRITETDEFEVMPPPESGKKLTSRQIETIRRWIADGAEWNQHWAYVVPERPPVPDVTREAWPRNAIDRFVLSRLESEGRPPSPEANGPTLVRRLSLDILGLPPSPGEVDAFVADDSDDAYEKLVDRLLASPHYGERLAIFWLDLVRFADTRGYHSDNPRNVSPYRDYVIRSFNENKPFDEFTIEQLAGDLLPEPDRWERVASAYNKLNKTTEEGGAQAKEYEAKTVADRVRNVSETWMGATLGCAQCHDHKFDPYTSRDFYSMGAFFADIQEAPIMDRDQGIPLPRPEQEQRQDELERLIERAVEQISRQEEEAKAGTAEPVERHTGDRAKPSAVSRPPVPEPQEDRQLQELRQEKQRLEEERQALDKSLRRCLVSVSGPPRVVRVLPRGDWMDDSGLVVQPAIPACFGRLDTGESRATRLDLARWLVSRQNPLTARVFVNRLWKLFFGAGISRRLEDLGAMGELPTHPGLLDWLAVEFMESGWNIKHVVKLMVLSSTYRQSSIPTPELRERDPANRLLARQSRWRLDAELIRDNSLAISGLLSRKVGGESVKPYQPAGYWANLNFPKRKWSADQGEDQYRRGLYTWWQRTFPHPSLIAFDAPSREECTAERPRSNVPQQALVLLNDPTHVEAARALAELTLREGGQAAEAKARWAFRRALCREPEGREIEILLELRRKHRQAYSEETEAASRLARVGQKPVPEDIEPAELAAWTSVARVLLNLHETVTRN